MHSLSDHYIKMQSFLHQHQLMWEDEILYRYPHHEAGYPQEFIDEMMNMPEGHLYRLGALSEYKGTISLPAHKEFYQEVEELSQVPKLLLDETKLSQDKLPYRKIKGKKEHELKHILGLLEELKWPFEHVLDVCGGMGHLSQIVSHHFNTQGTCVDKCEEFLSRGKERYHHWGSSRIDYQTQDVLKDQFPLSPELAKKTLSMGLHTCGPLAVRQLQLSRELQIPWLINFGCCYSKLENFDDYHLSAFAKEHPFKLSLPALTVATHSFMAIDRKLWEFKFVVKHFRYAIHIFIFENFPHLAKLPLGNSPKKLYEGDFPTYAYAQLKYLGVSLDKLPSEVTLRKFYQSKKLHQGIRRMILAGLLRLQTGRVLELYLLMDRALFMEESGYISELKRCFDRSLSPRNIALLSRLCQ
jgi:hypothetical protein